MSGSSRLRSKRLMLRDIVLAPCSSPFSLTLHQGETLVLLSEETATSSTLCDVIGGFASAWGGSIQLDDASLTDRPPAARPVALVTPRDPVFGHLDVAGNILLPLRARRASLQEQRTTLNHVLALTGLDAQARTRADTLNPEMAFRLKLARALAYAPSVLMIEGMISGLDLRAARKTRQMLGTLQKALGLTMIYVAQDREDALWLGGRIALFADRTLVQCADAATLLDRPEDERTANLFGEANLLAGRVLDIEEDVARIHLACGGVAEAMAAPDLEADTLCTLCIRPDRIAPLFGASLALDENDHPLTATIQSVLHTGEQIRLRLRLSDGGEIELRRPLLQATRAMVPGTSLQLAWQASQAVAFPMKDAL